MYGLSAAVVVGASVIEDESAHTKDAKTIEITMDGSIAEYPFGLTISHPIPFSNFGNQGSISTKPNQLFSKYTEFSDIQSLYYPF